MYDPYSIGSWTTEVEERDDRKPNRSADESGMSPSDLVTVGRFGFWVSAPRVVGYLV